MKTLTFLCWRKFVICAFVITFFLVSNAQPPQSFKYQTVLRNASGHVISNQNFEFDIAILQGNASGVEVFSETHNTTTNSFGLANLDIGSVNTSRFAAIDWANEPYFVQVLVDGTVMGTSQLLSVPYALHANTVENDQVNDADPDPTNELQDITFSNGVLGITQGSSIPLNTILPNIDTSNTNELQDISLSGTDLSISGGSTVDLSVIQDGSGTDNQELSLHNKRNLKISGGNIISLPYLLSENDGSSTNELQTLTKSGLDISLDQNGGLVRDSILTEAQVDAMVTNNGYQLAANDNDTDPTNEIQVLSISSDTIFLTYGGTIILPIETDPVYATDSAFIKSGVSSWNSSLAKNILSTDTSRWGQDANPANELNKSVVLNGTNLEITDTKTITTDLSPLINDADADPANEIQTISRAGLTVMLNKNGGVFQDSVLTETDVDAILSDNGYQLKTNDLDIDSTNELNESVVLNGTDLEVTDAGGTISTDLSSLADDADADPLNEIQTISRSALTVSLNKTGGTFQDSVLTESDVDAMASNNGFQLEINDMDIDPTNELQSLSISNDTIFISDGNQVKLTLSTILADADVDTKIQVDKNADEDNIRFDLAGSERWIMKNARLEPKNTGYSVFIGEDAGKEDDLTDNANTFISYNNGCANTSGHSNTSLGYSSLNSNTTGYCNTIFGCSNLGSSLNSSNNVVIGMARLGENTTGSQHTFIGFNSSCPNTTADQNVGMGVGSLTFNKTGSYNVAIGYNTLFHNLEGPWNTAIGYEALYSISTSPNYTIWATAIGYNAGRTGHSYTTAIGNYSYPSGLCVGCNISTNTINDENKLWIDNNSSIFPLIYGEFNNKKVCINGSLGIGTQLPATGYTLDLNGKALSVQSTFDVSSDRRVKKNISQINQGLKEIELFNPVTFEYTNEYQNNNKDLSSLKYGFIAQEVKEIIPEAVSIVEEKVGSKIISDFNVLNTSSIPPLLVSAIKQLKNENEVLKNVNTDLKNESNRLVQRLEKLEALMGKIIEKEHVASIGK